MSTITIIKLILFDKNNIYYFLRESGDLDFVFRESFFIKIYHRDFFYYYPTSISTIQQERRKKKRKEISENYRIITGNYVPVIEARLILDPNRRRRRTSTCSPIVS